MIENIHEYYTLPVLKDLGFKLGSLMPALDRRDYSYERYFTCLDSYYSYLRDQVSQNYSVYLSWAKDFKYPSMYSDYDVAWFFLAVPLKELPLFMGSLNDVIQYLLKYRMEIGK